MSRFSTPNPKKKKTETKINKHSRNDSVKKEKRDENKDDVQRLSSTAHQSRTRQNQHELNP